MNIEQKIDRVLTEYNFDRMSFDEAKKELLNLHSVSKCTCETPKPEKIHGLIKACVNCGKETF